MGRVNDLKQTAAVAKYNFLSLWAELAGEFSFAFLTLSMLFDYLEKKKGMSESSGPTSIGGICGSGY